MTGSSQTARAYGKTLTKTAGFDSILIKNKKFKISSNFNISSRYNQSFIDDVKTEASSRKASIASMSLSHMFFLKDASLFLRPSYSTSLNILDAKKDGAGLSRDSAHANFDIFKFYGNYGKKFTIPYLQTPASYAFSVDSQISKQRLYGIDQFSSGGFYSVRGFRSSSISADSGYNIRNEFSTNLGQLILPQFNSEKISKKFSYLNYLSLTPFYDYGYVRMKGDTQSGRLSGAGFKLGFVKKDFNASLTFSRAVSKSQMLLQNRNEGSIVYFNIGSELDFF
jgi:hemolysin activation/secretion protein